MIHDLFATIVTWYMAHINYPSIIILMAIESSFIPFPSEVVVPPAAWKAAEGSLNIFGVVACGVAGSLIGALVNYYLALFLGRGIVYRVADWKIMHAMMIDRKKIEQAEAYFLKYGNMSTFIGRLIPAIRQLISIPAGLARMRLDQFLLYTTLGSFIWNAILAALGFFLYSKKELLEEAYHNISYAALAIGGLFVVFLVVKGLKKAKKRAG